MQLPGQVKASQVSTLAGTETTENTYNSLRVLTGAVTKDQSGRTVLVTDATPYLNEKGQVIESLRNLPNPMSRSDVLNPNTGLITTTPWKMPQVWL